MENIEQLKADNAKLTERLNNAAKFFREQKAQIDALTKEKEEIATKLQGYKDFETNTINKVVPELEEELSKYKNTTKLLNKSIDELNNQINERDSKISKLEEDLQKKIDQMKTIDLEQKKIIKARDQWMGIAKELEKKVKEFDVAKEEVEIKLETIQKEYEDKFNQQEKEINELTNHKLAIENDYQELEKTNAKLEECHKSDVKKYEEAEKILKKIDSVKKAYYCLKDFLEIDNEQNNKNSKITSVNENPMNGQMIRMA